MRSNAEAGPGIVVRRRLTIASGYHYISETKDAVMGSAPQCPGRYQGTRAINANDSVSID
jgi:hypothetical protein